MSQGGGTVVFGELEFVVVVIVAVTLVVVSRLVTLVNGEVGSVGIVFPDV